MPPDEPKYTNGTLAGQAERLSKTIRDLGATGILFGLVIFLVAIITGYIDTPFFRAKAIEVETLQAIRERDGLNMQMLGLLRTQTAYWRFYCDRIIAKNAEDLRICNRLASGLPEDGIGTIK